MAHLSLETDRWDGLLEVSALDQVSMVSGFGLSSEVDRNDAHSDQEFEFEGVYRRE